MIPRHICTHVSMGFTTHSPMWHPPRSKNIGVTRSTVDGYLFRVHPQCSFYTYYPEGRTSAEYIFEPPRSIRSFPLSWLYQANPWTGCKEKMEDSEYVMILWYKFDFKCIRWSRNSWPNFFRSVKLFTTWLNIMLLRNKESNWKFDNKSRHHPPTNLQI